MPTNADIKEHGPLLALDALRYSLNVPSVQMQYLVGAQRRRPTSPSRWASPASKYIMGQDPGLSLALGSVPVNLTNMTRRLRRLRRSRARCTRPPPSWRSATGTIGSSTRREDNGPETTQPMTQAEAYLTALDPGGQHQSRDATCCGARARSSFDPNGAAPARRASRPGPPTTSATCPASATCRAAW